MAKLFEQGSFLVPANLTAEEIIARRKSLDKNQPKYGSARYIGEGLGHAFTGLFSGIGESKLDKAESAERKRIRDMFAGMLGGGSAPSVRPGSYSGQPGGSPAFSEPDPNAPQAIADDTMRALDRPIFSPFIEYDQNNPENLAADTMAALGQDPQYIKYDNQGAIRNQPLDPKLTEALSFLPEIGVEGRVVSGGQHAIGTGGPRTGSTRHDLGGAGDMDFYRDGRRLSTDNPEDMPYFNEITRRAVGAGLTGMGEGADYMGAGRMHLGYGAPAVWGANGSTANAPDWLRQAYSQGAAEYGTPQPSTRVADAGGTTRFSGSNSPYVSRAREIAAEEGIPEDLFLALIQQESTWNPEAVSPKGAIGFGQLMPGTAAELGVDPNDPEQNLRGSARYLKQQLDRFGSPELALAAYNAGPGRVEEYGGVPPFEETQNYVSTIMGGGGGGAPQAAPAQYSPQQGGAGTPDVAALMEIISSPFADAGMKAVAQQMLSQQMPQAPQWQFIDGMGLVDMNNPPPELMAGQYQEPQETKDPISVGGVLVDPDTYEPLFDSRVDEPKTTSDITNYEYYKADALSRGETPLPFEKWAIMDETASAGTPATDDPLRERLMEKQGEAWSAAIDAGTNAARARPDLVALRELSSVAPSGALEGRMAEMFPEYNDAAAARQAIIKRVAPTLRAEGSGSTSDIEYEGMVQSLGRLINSPEANMAIADMMIAKGQIDIERADVVRAYQTGKMTFDDAVMKMSELDSRSIMPDSLRKIIWPDGKGPEGGGAPPQGSASPQGAADTSAVPSNFANNQTISNMAKESGVTIEDYWSILDEEERAQWLK